MKVYLKLCVSHWTSSSSSCPSKAFSWTKQKCRVIWLMSSCHQCLCVRMCVHAWVEKLHSIMNIHVLYFLIHNVYSYTAVQLHCNRFVYSIDIVMANPHICDYEAFLNTFSLHPVTNWTKASGLCTYPASILLHPAGEVLLQELGSKAHYAVHGLQI